jgi:hypothetical protein
MKSARIAFLRSTFVNDFVGKNMIAQMTQINIAMDDNMPVFDKYWLNDDLAQPTPAAHAFVGVALIIITVLSIGGNAVVLIVYAVYVGICICLKTPLVDARN